MIVIEQTLLDLLSSKVKSGNSGKSFSGHNYSVNQGSASTSNGSSSSGSLGQTSNAASGTSAGAGATAPLGGNPVASSIANGGLGGIESSASANGTGVNVPSVDSKGRSTIKWIIVGGITLGVIIIVGYLYLERKKEQEMVQEKANS